MDCNLGKTIVGILPAVSFFNLCAPTPHISSLHFGGFCLGLFYLELVLYMAHLRHEENKDWACMKTILGNYHLTNRKTAIWLDF